MREAEAPSIGIVRSHIRNCIRLVRKRVQVLLKFGKCEFGIDGCRIADYVKIMVLEIDDTSPRRVFDERFRDLPFIWNRPIERLRSGRYFVHL